MKGATFIGVLASCWLGGWLCGYGCGSMAEPLTHRTIVRHDTVLIEQPPVTRMCTVGVIRTRVLPALPPAPADAMPPAAGRDIVCADSIEVVLPRHQAQVDGDGFRAFVSGYRPALDSIFIDRTTFAVRQKPSPWSVGVSAGVALTPAGVQPYVGIGISFRLF